VSARTSHWAARNRHLPRARWRSKKVSSDVIEIEVTMHALQYLNCVRMRVI